MSVIINTAGEIVKKMPMDDAGNIMDGTKFYTVWPVNGDVIQVEMTANSKKGIWVVKPQKWAKFIDGELRFDPEIMGY